MGPYGNEEVLEEERALSSCFQLLVARRRGQAVTAGSEVTKRIPTSAIKTV